MLLNASVVIAALINSCKWMSQILRDLMFQRNKDKEGRADWNH